GGDVDRDVDPGALREVGGGVGRLGTRAVVDGYGFPPADSVPVHRIDMDGPAVGGREGEVESDLVGIIESGGVASGGVRALQGLDHRRRAAPDVATALVKDQAGLG